MSTIEDQRDYQLSTRQSERIVVPMKSSISSQYISKNLLPHQEQPSNEEEKSTYSFRYITKKLQHAKSHGELYQPQAPLPLPPMNTINQNENDFKSTEKYSSDSTRSFSMATIQGNTTTTVPIGTSSTRSSSSSVDKLPFWKRFKQILAPIKQSKDRDHSPTDVPSFPISKSSSNETSN